jgi:hypothetical protein
MKIPTSDEVGIFCFLGYYNLLKASFKKKLVIIIL